MVAAVADCNFFLWIIGHVRSPDPSWPMSDCLLIDLLEKKGQQSRPGRSDAKILVLIIAPNKTGGLGGGVSVMKRRMELPSFIVFSCPLIRNSVAMDDDVDESTYQLFKWSNINHPKNKDTNVKTTSMKNVSQRYRLPSMFPMRINEQPAMLYKKFIEIYIRQIRFNKGRDKWSMEVKRFAKRVHAA